MNSLFHRTFVALAPAAAKAATPARTTLPFNFERTASKNLPVYLKYVSARRVPLTEVRKFTGDTNSLKNELHRLLGPNVRIEKRTNTLLVTGNYVSKIKHYISGLGF